MFTLDDGAIQEWPLVNYDGRETHVAEDIFVCLICEEPCKIFPLERQLGVVTVRRGLVPAARSPATMASTAGFRTTPRGSLPAAARRPSSPKRCGFMVSKHTTASKTDSSTPSRSSARFMCARSELVNSCVRKRKPQPPADQSVLKQKPEFQPRDRSMGCSPLCAAGCSAAAAPGAGRRRSGRTAAARARSCSWNRIGISVGNLVSTKRSQQLMHAGRRQVLEETEIGRVLLWALVLC